MKYALLIDALTEDELTQFKSVMTTAHVQGRLSHDFAQKVNNAIVSAEKFGRYADTEPV